MINDYSNVQRKNGVTIAEQEKLPRVALNDPFKPSNSDELVVCLHCGRLYPIKDVLWVNMCGLWCCPFSDCSGAGVGFDIHKASPDITR